MSPYGRFIWTLMAALLLWSPVAFQVVNGSIDGTIAALLFLAAIVLAYLGTGVVDMITSNYRVTSEHTQRLKLQIELMEKRAAEEQNRRASDKAKAVSE